MNKLIIENYLKKNDVFYKKISLSSENLSNILDKFNLKSE